MLKQLELVVHEMDETGHRSFVCPVNRGLECCGVSITQFLRGLFAVSLYPSRVTATIANEVQAFANQEDFSCKLFRYDTWNHRLLQSVLLLPDTRSWSSARIFDMILRILFMHEELVIGIRQFPIVYPLP